MKTWTTFLMVVISSAGAGCAVEEGELDEVARDELALDEVALDEGDVDGLEGIEGDTDVAWDSELAIEEDGQPGGDDAVEAAATMKCSAAQHKLMAVPEGDVEIWLRTCVRSNGGSQREAAIRIDTMHTTTFPGREGDLFEYFRVKVRLERNDTPYKTKPCTYTTQANHRGWYGPYACKSGVLSTPLRGGWTADGVLEWSGGGTRHVWDLQGSPRIN